MVAWGQQEGVQHHLIGRWAQLRGLCGDVGSQCRQLPLLSKGVHAPLPSRRIALHRWHSVLGNGGYLSLQDCCIGMLQAAEAHTGPDVEQQDAAGHGALPPGPAEGHCAAACQTPRGWTADPPDVLGNNTAPHCQVPACRCYSISWAALKALRCIPQQSAWAAAFSCRRCKPPPADTHLQEPGHELGSLCKALLCNEVVQISLHRLCTRGRPQGGLLFDDVQGALEALVLQQPGNAIVSIAGAADNDVLHQEELMSLNSEPKLKGTATSL